MGRRSGHPSLSAKTFSAIGALSLCVLSSAQAPKVLAPRVPVPPREKEIRHIGDSSTQRTMGGLWRTDENFKSSIYLRNDLKTDPLTVRPVVYLSNGKRYELDAVKLEPSGTAVVNINEGLRDKGIASWATLYGYVEIEYEWPWSAVCATVQNVDPVHSLIFDYGPRPMPTDSNKAAPSQKAQSSHQLEGMWWKQERDVTGFVAVSNLTEAPIQATVQVTGAGDAIIREHPLRVSPHGTKLVILDELLSLAETAGGIRVSYVGPEGALVVNAGLQDPITGYSANLPVAPSPDPEAAIRL